MSHKEEAEMTTIDHQHAARTAVMNSIRQIEPNLYQNPHNPERYYGGLADDMLAAATPHLRAAWEEDLAERVRLWKAGALDVPIFTATMHEVDAAFIAAARQWIPDALNRLDRIRKLIDPTKATPGSTAHKILQILNEAQMTTEGQER